jgi:hypothetical protein
VRAARSAAARYWRAFLALVVFAVVVLLAGGSFAAEVKQGDRPTRYEYPGIAK